MPITIKIGDTATPVTQERPVQATIRLKVRKTLDGNITVFDHPMIDIMIVPSRNKIVTIPKEEYGEEAYQVQRSFLNELIRLGVLELGSIQGTFLFNAFEATIAASESEEISPIQVLLLQIENILKREVAEIEQAIDYEEDVIDNFTNPDEEDSTELGQYPNEEDVRKREHSQNSSRAFYYYTSRGFLY
jgi:hypothetical protein